MKRVLVVSSGRADITGLSSVCRAAAANGGLELHLLLTGRHVRGDADYRAALAQFPAGTPIHTVGADLGGGEPVNTAMAMGAIAMEAAPVLSEVVPEVMVVLGDRLDMVPVVLSALPFNLPIAHIHGGELTLGAVDDRIRHAVTKLSHLHFVSGPEAAARVCRMGEEPWRIHVTGAPALDTLREQEVLAREAFLAEIGIADAEPFALMTVHPETNGAAPLSALEAVMAALEHLGMPVLATAANADMHGGIINERLEQAEKARPWLHYRPTLGARLFANALRHAAVMIGNSSSGIVEAGLFGLPVVDVGARQEGRTRGRNVISVPDDGRAIEQATLRLIGTPFDPAEVSLYGDGRAAERIVTALIEPRSRRELLAKTFFNGDASFTAPWSSAVAGVPVARDVAPELSGALMTRSTLVRHLRDLGVREGAVVCAHVALSRLGFVVGGARTVIEALLDAIGAEGTLVMPAFSGDLSDPADWRYPPVPVEWIEPIRAEMPPFDPRLTPTRRMGVVAELFRSWPDTLRSPHPQSSFAARGPAATRVVAEHPLDHRFGPRSPLARLEELNATVLMLGAPWNTISVFYRTQADAGPIERVRRRAPVHDGGMTTWVEYDDIEYSNFFFPDVAQHLLDVGIARSIRIGNGDALAFEAGRALPAVRKWRAERGI